MVALGISPLPRLRPARELLIFVAIRRRQLLRRHALDVPVPVGHHDYAGELKTTPFPPSDSDAASVVGRTFPSNDANADEFSIASRRK